MIKTHFAIFALCPKKDEVEFAVAFTEAFVRANVDLTPDNEVFPRIIMN